MKSYYSFFFIFILIVSCFSCTKTLEISLDSVPEEQTETGCPSFQVHLNDFVSYIRQNKNIDLTKVDNAYSISPILANSDTLMYLVNYVDGWEVLSADSRFPKVLAFAQTGRLTLSEFYEEDTPQSVFFTDYLHILTEARHNPSFSMSTLSGLLGWEDVIPVKGDTWSNWMTYHSVVLHTELIEQDHLLETKWNQNGGWASCAPYMDNSMTSHCYTGCLPVAAAQVLYYLHYKLGVPSVTYGNVTCNAYIQSGESSVVLNNTNTVFDNSNLSSIHWDNMPKTSSEVVSPDDYIPVSTLLVRLGYLANATYTATGTPVSMSAMRDVFENEYGISCTYSIDLDFSHVYQQVVEQQMPCIFSIWDSSSYNVGHAVVIDGYHRKKEWIRRDQVRNNNSGVIQYRTIVEQVNTDYLAINWGYSGSGDSESGSTRWYYVCPEYQPDHIYWQRFSGTQTYTRVHSYIYGFSI